VSGEEFDTGKLDALVASLAIDHDDLKPRLRTVANPAQSSRSGVRLHAHYFAFRGSKPTMEQFVEILSTKLVSFCLPRRHIKKVQSDWKDLPPNKVTESAISLHNRALDLFKKANKATNRNGEFGELIAYLLIESVLQAPQLVAKMSLKTSPQMPVHGSDGIHCKFESGGKKLRLFWGESKCYQAVNKALAEAAKSVAENLEHNKMGHELFLIEQHADLSGLPTEVEEALMEFLDPYSESFNLRIDTSVMLIVFDFDAFAEVEGLAPESVEAEFEERLGAELEKLAARLDGELEKHHVPQHDLEVFFLPLPSVIDMREHFQNRIGWTT
jgi:hypothetical protein